MSSSGRKIPFSTKYDLGPIYSPSSNFIWTVIIVHVIPQVSKISFSNIKIMDKTDNYSKKTYLCWLIESCSFIEYHA
jgi:hypothetical protein